MTKRKDTEEIRIREAKNDRVQTPQPPPAEAIGKDHRKEPALEYLPVAYTDAEVLVLADQMARFSSEKQALEEQFEVIKLDFKHKLEALEASLKSVTRKIQKRTHYENVDCIFILEMPTPNEKTLVRLDTGDLVRVVPMDSRDYQDPLPMVLKPEPPADPVDRTPFNLEPPKPGNGQAAAANKETETRPV